MKDVFFYFVYAVLGIFSLCVLAGVILHIFLQITRVIAYFTYIGLFYFESISKIKFYIPQKGTKRIIMDINAAFFPLIAIQIIIAFLKHSSSEFIFYLPKFIPISTAIIGLINIAVIYFISYKSKPSIEEKDEGLFDKMNKLNIPKFLKFLE